MSKFKIWMWCLFFVILVTIAGIVVLPTIFNVAYIFYNIQNPQEYVRPFDISNIIPILSFIVATLGSILTAKMLKKEIIADDVPRKTTLAVSYVIILLGLMASFLLLLTLLLLLTSLDIIHPIVLLESIIVEYVGIKVLIGFVLSIVLGIFIMRKTGKRLKEMDIQKYYKTITWMITISIIIICLTINATVLTLDMLNPSPPRPDTCMASSGFYCTGKPVVSKLSIKAVFGNGLGNSVNFLGNEAVLPSYINCKGIYLCNKNVACTDSEYTLEDGKEVTMMAHDCDFSNLTHYVKGEITIPYIVTSNNTKDNVTISIVAKIKR